MSPAPDLEAAQKLASKLGLVSVALHGVKWSTGIHSLAIEEGQQLGVRFSTPRMRWSRDDNAIMGMYMFVVEGGVFDEDQRQHGVAFLGQVEFVSAFAFLEGVSPDEIDDMSIVSFLLSTGFLLCVPEARHVLRTLASNAGWLGVNMPLQTRTPSNIAVERHQPESDESNESTDT